MCTDIEPFFKIQVHCCTQVDESTPSITFVSLVVFKLSEFLNGFPLYNQEESLWNKFLYWYLPNAFTVTQSAVIAPKETTVLNQWYGLTFFLPPLDSRNV